MSENKSCATDHVGGSAQAKHLCVLVHGLWGNPEQMRNIAKALRDQYPPDELYLLLVKRNSGSFTYDGIELGGERVCAEIEEEMRSFESGGGKFTKFSIVGYSLGGLVARYAVGLLDAKGALERLECANFATFASPHLGVRSPLKGWHNQVWNVVGARSLSTSGRQLFTIDHFRETGRPLLSVLADPSSIFMRGLRRFRRHTLYANIINDRSAVYYTTAIQKTDPYHKKLQSIEVNCLPDCGGVLLDPDKPFTHRSKLCGSPERASATSVLIGWAKRIPFLLTVSVLVPIGTVAFLCNSVIQTVRSANRIRRHESRQVSFDIDAYRVPLLIKELRGEVENVYEVLNSSQNQDFLTTEDEDDENDMASEDKDLLKRERRLSIPNQPTLALTPYQFEMIRSLDSLQWRKYPVWIHKDRHSHAAIIVRMDKNTFDEGFIVLAHFARQEFLV